MSKRPLLTPEQKENFFVAHFSPSAIRQYLTDRQAFFKRYVRLEFETTGSPALVEGNLFHTVLERYWKIVQEGQIEIEIKGVGEENPVYKETTNEFNLEEAFQNSVEQFTVDGIFDSIDWGKTGSLDKSLKSVRQALDFYFEELPVYKNVLAVEEKFNSSFEDLDGEEMPIPLKGFTDLVGQLKEDKDDEFTIEDHKLVSTVKQQEESCPAYELQAAAYWFLTRKAFGINPKKMIFRQVKKSKNRDGGPQVVPYVVEYTHEILERFLEIYRRIVKELSGQPLIDEETGTLQFLPNPFAQFGREDSWNDFCEEVANGKKFTFEEMQTIRENRFSDSEFEAIDL